VKSFKTNKGKLMKQSQLLLAAVLTMGTAAYAHFGFVVPHAGARTADLIISEVLTPEAGVGIDVIKTTRLFIRDIEGKDTPLATTKFGNVFRIDLPGKGNRIIHGMADLGISPNARAPKPYLLLYYPKTLIGPLLGEKATLGGDTPVELVPEGEPGKTTLLLLSKGKPLPDSEVTLVLPGGEQKKVRTDSTGHTPVISQTGRLAAWARFWEPSSGDREGKPYEQLRHYAMLVFDSYPKPTNFTTLPEATSSFGAVAEKGWLYVYGGHVVPTHNYSTAAVSGKFNRLNLETGEWQTLGTGPSLQGLNLAAANGKVYRVGGMQPRNAPGEKQDIHSIAEVASFDPATRSWQSLTPLPGARSSHDVAVIGDQLFVAGGWNLKGAEGSSWAHTILSLNLKDPNAQWQSASQPFERRALITAVHKGRLYVMGGITKTGAVSAEVDIYDPATSSWSKGPALPGTQTMNFAPAAAEHNGRLLVSLADGTLIRLDDVSNQWQEAGISSPRLAHRMVSVGTKLLIIGGAEKGANLNLVEALKLD